jgi:SAM-dependent methyltransferase
MPDTTVARGVSAAHPAAPRWNWTILRRLVAAWFRDRSQFARAVTPRTCPICGYHGMFVSVGKPPRWDVRCLNCGARERHRLTHLWATEGGGDKLAGKRILHFAPEKAVVRRMRGNPLYETADLHQKGTTHKVDITRVDLPDARYDAVIAHHVLEHVDDDRAAIAELFRLLRPGGTAVLSVPINPSRRETYENPTITAPALRVLHFGGDDHKRYYGLDFAERLADAGFAVATFRMPPHDEVRYGLLRDEWIYIATKPAAPPSGA